MAIRCLYPHLLYLPPLPPPGQLFLTLPTHAASSSMAPHTFLLLIILAVLLALAFQPSSSTSILGFRVRLRHVDAGRNFSKLQLVQRGINRRRQKLTALKNNGDDIQALVHVGSGEFVVNLTIGTPPVPFPAIMDTGSDLIWTQCDPCEACFQQSTPVFNPHRSSSFSNVSCSSELCKGVRPTKCVDSCEYRYTYGDESLTEGFMATETITFGGESLERVSLPRIGFGCGINNQASGMNQTAGLLGLGRGVLSLVSQIGARRFSYCFTSIHEDKTSRLLFGSLASSNFTGNFSGTPLIRNPLMPTFYYLSLEGITVGGTQLPIPEAAFQLGEDGRGGMIIDSGTTITYLPEDVFAVLKNAFISQMELRVANSSDIGLELCFHLPARGGEVEEVKVPRLIFHFKGLDLTLPVENYMVSDPEMGLLCLAIDPTSSISIFGNIQQQNMLVLHDLQRETLSFLPTQCDKV